MMVDQNPVILCFENATEPAEVAGSGGDRGCGTLRIRHGAPGIADDFVKPYIVGIPK